jgi:hypothetical protein
MKHPQVRQRRMPRREWLGRVRRRALSIPVALALCACLWPAPGAGASADSSVVARMDDLWQSKDDLDSVRRLIETGEQAAADRADFEIAWRIARACVWLGSLQENRAFRKALAVKGMEWGRKAKELEPQRVEGHYYYASTVGQYGTTIGMVTAVAEGIAGKFEESMGRSYEIDRDYDEGGPMIALGRFLYLLPWPKRDLKRSRLLLEEVRQRHPGRLIGRVYLADTYYALDEKKKARRELHHILRSDILPQEAPMQPHELARQRMQEWFSRVS